MEYNIETPCSFSFKIDSNIWFLDCGSIPTVGSSIIIICGSCAIAQAIFNLLFIPPEKVLGLFFLLSVRPTKSSAKAVLSFNFCPRNPYKLAKKDTFFSALISSYIAKSCGTIPILCFIFFILQIISTNRNVSTVWFQYGC